jgi:hypothetical protein
MSDEKKFQNVDQLRDLASLYRRQEEAKKAQEAEAYYQKLKSENTAVWQTVQAHVETLCERAYQAAILGKRELAFGLLFMPELYESLAELRMKVARTYKWHNIICDPELDSLVREVLKYQLLKIGFNFEYIYDHPLSERIGERRQRIGWKITW